MFQNDFALDEEPPFLSPAAPVESKSRRLSLYSDLVFQNALALDENLPFSCLYYQCRSCYSMSSNGHSKSWYSVTKG
jgi:hypothetical protein